MRAWHLAVIGAVLSVGLALSLAAWQVLIVLLVFAVLSCMHDMIQSSLSYSRIVRLYYRALAREEFWLALTRLNAQIHKAPPEQQAALWRTIIEVLEAGDTLARNRSVQKAGADRKTLVRFLFQDETSVDTHTK